MKNTHKLEVSQIVRYWHPRKGGWYHAVLIKAGRKWATVAPLGKPNSHHRISVANVEPYEKLAGGCL